MAKIIEKKALECASASEHWFIVTTCPRCGKEVILRDDEFLHDVYICPCGARNEAWNTTRTVYTANEAIEKGFLTQDEIDGWDKTMKSEEEIAKEDLIDEIMSTFNFEKVESVMKSLDWKWANSISQSSVPTRHEIMNCARELLSEAYDKQTTIATGGFYAECYKDEEYNEVSLKLYFCIDNYESTYNFNDGELKYY